MAYTRNWDEDAPPGTAPANTLDTIIQEFKTDIRERIEQVVPDWSDDGVDPKRVVVHTGTTRPTGPNAGELFFDTDDTKLEVWNGTAWITIFGGASVLQAAEANRPAATSVSSGTLFWATDTDVLYVEEDDAWLPVGGGGIITDTLFVEYDETAPVGSKEASIEDFFRLMIINVSGTTDPSGDIVVDLTELTGDWQATDIVAAGLAADEAPSIITGPVNNTEAYAIVQAVDLGSSTITFRVFDNAGVARTGATVEFVAYIPFVVMTA